MKKIKCASFIVLFFISAYLQAEQKPTEIEPAATEAPANEMYYPYGPNYATDWQYYWQGRTKNQHRYEAFGEASEWIRGVRKISFGNGRSYYPGQHGYTNTIYELSLQHSNSEILNRYWRLSAPDSLLSLRELDVTQEMIDLISSYDKVISTETSQEKKDQVEALVKNEDGSNDVARVLALIKQAEEIRKTSTEAPTEEEFKKGLAQFYKVMTEARNLTTRLKAKMISWKENDKSRTLRIAKFVDSNPVEKMKPLIVDSPEGKDVNSSGGKKTINDKHSTGNGLIIGR